MLRFVFISLVFLAFPEIAEAQQGRYSVATNKCVAPGKQVTLNGTNMGTSQIGSIVMRKRGERHEMGVVSWGDKRLRVQVPRRRIEAGAFYEVIWQRDRRVVATFGNITICGAGSTALPPSQRARRDEVPAPNGSPEYIVSATQGQAAAASAALQAQGAQLLRTRPLPSLGRVLLVFSLPGNLTASQAQTVLDGAADNAQIDLHNIYSFAADPRLYAAEAIGDDPLRQCRLRRNVAVGIIDGPVNPRHSSLKGVKISRTTVLDPNDNPPSPDHGTAVASLIAGNGTDGITGFAQGSSIFAVSAFSKRKGRTGAELEHIAAGLDWLAGQRVRIVNLSFAGRPNAAFRDILAASARRGMIMIGASGNDGKTYAAYPAGAPEVIAVTAVDARGKLYRKANRGKHLEFSAPGVDLYAAKGGGGGYQSGTSYAAPIVTSLIARRAALGSVSLKSARSGLRKNVTDLGPNGRDPGYGWGLVQSAGC